MKSIGNLRKYESNWKSHKQCTFDSEFFWKEFQIREKSGMGKEAEIAYMDEIWTLNGFRISKMLVSQQLKFEFEDWNL